MNIGRDIIGYEKSTDYKLLVELARKQSVVCIADYHGRYDYRDVAQTVWYEYRNGEEVFAINARGIDYVHVIGVDDFIDQCVKQNIEFLLPTKEIK